jgi:hypothetical protein
MAGRSTTMWADDPQGVREASVSLWSDRRRFVQRSTEPDVTSAFYEWRVNRNSRRAAGFDARRAG